MDRATLGDRLNDDVSPTIPLAAVLIDLDNFGPLNDALGRDAGDAVLQAFERTLAGSLPKDAIVARIGGDEYAVGLPATSAEAALIILDEIRTHLDETHYGLSAEHQGDVGRIGMSAGIASRPPHAESVDGLLRCADQALMRAKREGGGRIAIWVEEKMALKSNYYTPAQLDRLSRLSAATGRTEASLLREALDTLLDAYRAEV